MGYSKIQRLEAQMNRIKRLDKQMKESLKEWEKLRDKRNKAKEVFDRLCEEFKIRNPSDNKRKEQLIKELDLFTQAEELAESEDRKERKIKV